jgi:aldehyde:ferredoxin oxidoreductase
MCNGYHKKLVRIDLTQGKVTKEPLSVDIIKNFIGGKGLGAYLLTKELKARVDPLSPKNKIIIATGPLQGSIVPICGRYCIVTKSPLTGLFLDSHAGGYVGSEIKFAGYDAIIIEGASNTPCYISIIDDDIQIRDAYHLKGLSTLDKEIAIKKDLNDTKARIMSIGPAGENLVKYSCITSDSFRNVGRGGVGSVFGSKNLLGVAVKGSKKEIQIVNREKFKHIAQNIHKRATQSRKSKHLLYQVGTPWLLQLASDRDQLPIKNFQVGTHSSPTSIGKEGIQQYKTKKLPCYKCTLQCAHVFDQKFDFQDNSDHIVGVPEYETLGLIAANCEVNLETTIEANYLLNKYGLDSISTGNVIAFFMECVEKELIPAEFAREAINFGDNKGLLKLIHKIAHREGVGDILAEGTRIISKKFGRGTESFAMNVKGLELAAWDPRGKLALGLSYATAAVGASHLRGWPSTTKLPKNEAVSSEIVSTLVEQQDLKLLKDSLIICHFTHSIIPALTIEDTQHLYQVIFEDNVDVRQIAQNIWSLTRFFNMREFDKAAGEYDTLPRRLLEEPLPTGIAAGSKAFQSEEDFKRGLEYLYEQRQCYKDGDLSNQEKGRIEVLIGI